jgi:hypothetical protein
MWRPGPLRYGCTCLYTHGGGVYDALVSVQAGDAAEQSEGSKKKWYEEKKKRQEEQLAKMGLAPEDAHRLESAEVAEAKYKKKVRG